MNRARRSCAWVAAALIGALYACPSTAPTGAALHRSISVGTPAPSVDAGILVNATGAAAAPQTCPTNASVFCDAGCCASGQTCAGDGGCAETTGAAGCPADMPIVCSTAVSCGGGSCVAVDSSGNNRNFVIQSPAGFVSGKFGTGVSTNQRTSCAGPWMTMDAGGLPAGNDPMTLELWLRTDGGVGQTLIYGQGDESAGRWLVQDPAGQILWPTGSQYAGVVVDGAWHFVAVTWDGSRGAIYLDGVLRSNRVLGTTIATPADAGIVLGGNCNPFPGDIDELRVLSFVADGGQIAADYDAGRLGPGSGVVGLWHFDEGETQRCCASGTVCDSVYGCTAISFPPPNTTACSDGGFCPAGTGCTPAGCGGGDGGVCPPAFPVDCGNQTCCAAGQVCVAGGCGNDAPDASVPTCAAGSFAIQASATTVDCCPIDPSGAQPQLVVNASYSCGPGNPTFHGDLCVSTNANNSCPTYQPTCTQGYVCCGVNATIACAIIPSATVSCGTGQPCTGDATHPGGCCTVGTTCAGPGICCAAAEVLCGAGCCPSAQCVNGTCGAAQAKICSPACPSGTVCNDGYCVAAQPAPTVCGNGTPCGSECCPNGESCINGTCARATVSITCPDNLPFLCGPAGPCCRAGFTCFGNAGPGPSGFYCVGQFPAQHGGPQGVACGTGDYCDTGLLCGGGGVCCPGGDSQACGAECCTADETCANGQCGCPAGEITCGTACCPPGSKCANGACVPACANGEACGGFCCDAPYTCKNGACSCPNDHPVECGGACCLAGGTCFDSVDCNCPPGRAACGLECCAPGDVCTATGCGQPSSSGGGCGAPGVACGTGLPPCCSNVCGVPAGGSQGLCH